MKKKLFVMVLTGVLMSSLVACGNDNATVAETGEAVQAEATTVVAEEETTVVDEVVSTVAEDETQTATEDAQNADGVAAKATKLEDFVGNYSNPNGGSLEFSYDDASGKYAMSNITYTSGDEVDTNRDCHFTEEDIISADENEIYLEASSDADAAIGYIIFLRTDGSIALTRASMTTGDIEDATFTRN